MNFLRISVLLVLIVLLQACNMGKFYAGKRINGVEYQQTSSSSIINTRESNTDRYQKENTLSIDSKRSIQVCDTIVCGEILQNKKHPEIFEPEVEVFALPDTVRTPPAPPERGLHERRHTYGFGLIWILLMGVVDGIFIGLIAFLIALIANPVGIAFAIGMRWAAWTAIIIWGIGLFTLVIWGP